MEAVDSPKRSPAAIERFVAAAKEAGNLDCWTYTAPTSILMLMPGQGLGAVADVMSVKEEVTKTGTPAVTLTLDVVHAPHIFGEFDEHPKQTLDEDAHYHFDTPAGVSVDAARFLGVVQAAGGKLPGKWGLQCLACALL
jgi:hypothetical protein